MAKLGMQTARSQQVLGTIAVSLLALVLACSRAPQNPAPSENPRDLGGVWQATGSADSHNTAR